MIGIRSGLARMARSRVARRLALWLALSLALPGLLIPGFWPGLLSTASPDYVFGEHHAAPWGVLALCLAWLWLKREQIRVQLDAKEQVLPILVGLALVVGASFLPASSDWAAFQGLLVALGALLIVSGRLVRLPAVALGVYGFAVFFPILVDRFAADSYVGLASGPLLALLTALGYPIASQGGWIQIPSLSGQAIQVVVTAACAGPATMAVFVSLFALMMLDVPLPPGRAVGLFLFGVVGTWLQSFLRLVYLLLTGYYLGEGALWTLHSYSIYIVFPLWYLIFAWLYFRMVGGPARRGMSRIQSASENGTRGG